MLTIPAAPIIDELDGTQLTIGIIVARYNWHITGIMLQLCQEELQRLHVAPENIHVISVPGSYELATTAKAMLSGHTYDALICFGCVVKGETRHDVVVCDTAAQGIQRVSLDTGIPIIFGVMCAENQDQAAARTMRGKDCAAAAVEMAHTVQMLSRPSAKITTGV
ncbi:MAG: 6,7-dimethyl-8-ribityllumazine synthase [Ktedonobacteraceae bacterium]|nr:6,7-dimethyl-8-ribityllumazine synthase [Ktedonobacteraceae bacterium]